MIVTVTLYVPAILFDNAHCFSADCWLIGVFLICVLFLLGGLKVYGYLNVATKLLM